MKNLNKPLRSSKNRCRFSHSGTIFTTLAKHLKVVEFVSPEKFEELEKLALTYGFRYVASGPLVRSSYRAGEFFISNMIRGKNEKKLYQIVESM
jgi:lipoate synthase